jgi:membrane-associated phospholipid phosphatase
MMRTFSAMLIFWGLLATQHLLFAQNDTTSVVVKKRNFFGRLAQDGKTFADGILYTYSRPFHWNEEQKSTAALVVTSALILTLVDDPIRSVFQDVRTDGLDRFERNVADKFGRPKQNYMFTGAMYGLGVTFDIGWMRDTGIILITSMSTSGLIQTYSKMIFGRARPETDEGPHTFQPFGGLGYTSFPSGHTVLAMTTGWVLAHRVKPKALKALFYGIGGATALSRVYADVHWFTDIGLGSVLAIVCADTMMKRFDEKRPGSSKKLFSWNLEPSPNGIALRGRF